MNHHQKNAGYEKKTSKKKQAKGKDKSFQEKKGLPKTNVSVNVGKSKGNAPASKRTLSKNQALDALDDLLTRPGASSAGAPFPAPHLITQPAEEDRFNLRVSENLSQKEVDNTETTLSRLERCLIRVQKGEPGPIKISDLALDHDSEKAAQKSGGIESYRKILKTMPQAQPGRPLVNVVGSSDSDLRFELLTLYELVIAARELKREQLQVSLVRLSKDEATAILKAPSCSQLAPTKGDLSPLDVAKMNGFLEIGLEAIQRDQNLRQHIDADSLEFRNLVESIRTIGLQNPPVIEVRGQSNELLNFVCISGHRRLLALETLGISKVTCALKVFESSKHRALAGLAENINREDLHFLDKADGYGLLEREGMTNGEIAALLDADIRTVNKYLRASKWDLGVKNRIRSLGPKTTTRFLLNALAAGERSSSELHNMIDKFLKSRELSPSKARPPVGVELKKKVAEFCTLVGCGNQEREFIEKALRFLGFMT